ncbi:MAG: ferrous iron transporter B [Clostridiales bacterium]|nr:ferrous iron transporter B [Clostridiales bacterium]
MASVLCRIFTNKFFALPIFFLVMYLVFTLTFNSAGAFSRAVLDRAIGDLTSLLDLALTNANASPVLRRLICDGICNGVGSVLSFLPTILILFTCLFLLEESGYMSCVASFMNSVMKRLGLPGQAIVPLLIGFGCSVPAIMATRTLQNKRERYMTIRLIPFMSCSAKLPIYSIFVSVFFPHHEATAMTGIYFSGIVIALLYAIVLNNTLYRGRKVGALIPAPVCKAPDFFIVLVKVKNSALEFLKKTFTVIFLASILIWFLQSFDLNLRLADSVDSSILAALGRCASPIFTPLGFDDWRAAAAIIAGLSAKEAVVSTLSVMSSAALGSSLPAMLCQIFSPLSAFSFLIFCLLYIPCIATLAIIRRETGGWRYALLMALSQIALAWITSFALFNIGSFII